MLTTESGGFNIRYHEVSPVGIDAPTAALALNDRDALFTAVSLVQFRLGMLVMAVNDRRRYNPSEERGLCHALH